MFISKQELDDLKCKAGQVPKLQAEITKIKEELDLSEDSFWPSTFMHDLYRKLRGLQNKTLKTVVREITARIDHQEKMHKMLFDHLGIEYAKVTEETKAGKQEKEVLRRVKTIKK